MLTKIKGTGSGTAPVVNLTYPFIDKTHVKATVNDVLVTLNWTGPAQVTFAAVVSSGAAWVVYRDTPSTPALVDFTNGAVLTEGDLDLAHTQHRYREEELADAILDAELDIQEVATDLAATQAELDAFEAEVEDEVAAAAASAAASAASAAAAATSATNSATSAGSAATAEAGAETALSEMLDLLANSGGGETGSRILSGGEVAWISAFTYTVSAAVYYINGALHSSLEQTISLAAADPTNGRIDVLALDDTGTLVKIAGTPSPTPSEPDIDPATQLQLTWVSVPAAATAPPTATGAENVYLENAEWVSSIVGTAAFNAASTSEPRTGTKAIAGTAVGGNASAVLLTRSADLARDSFISITFYIKSKSASWGTGRLRVYFQNSNGQRVGNIVTINNGAFGFSTSNVTTYQQVTIPLTTLAIPAGTQLRKLAIGATGSTFSLRIDDITMQPSGSTGTTSGGLTQATADARYLQRQNNLADITSASTARANLGLGTVALTVPDDAYDATSWNGNSAVPTKNAVRDKIESLTSAAMSGAMLKKSADHTGADYSTNTIPVVWDTEVHDNGGWHGFSSTVTITIASPGVVTWNAHGFSNGNTISFSTTVALPTGLVAGTVYYIVSAAANTFSVSATPGGAAINTTGSQSGTHTATNNSVLRVPAGVNYVQSGATVRLANVTASSSVSLILQKNGTTLFDGAASQQNQVSLTIPRVSFSSGPIPVSVGDNLEVLLGVSGDTSIDLTASVSDFWALRVG